ncbi:hypothetical protein [Francisella orientalis]|uniref:hypothetical protein n=1 Tax=Francisella orientalis TaxID=299583 RepID=UPI00025D504E|nr:hypothetical protein [Francisella orientalis]AFJ43540.1 DnaB_2, Replication initiation and membrane attachment [Francisella orientalis str. Toba 04]
MGLISSKTVNLSRISGYLITTISSNFRRLQGFFKDEEFDFDTITELSKKYSSIFDKDY